jgi:hypothetical protein
MTAMASPPITFPTTQTNYEPPDLQASKWPTWWSWPEILPEILAAAPSMPATQSLGELGTDKPPVERR